VFETATLHVMYMCPHEFIVTNSLNACVNVCIRVLLLVQIFVFAFIMSRVGLPSSLVVPNENLSFHLVS